MRERERERVCECVSANDTINGVCVSVRERVRVFACFCVHQKYANLVHQIDSQPRKRRVAQITATTTICLLLMWFQAYRSSYIPIKCGCASIIHRSSCD